MQELAPIWDEPVPWFALRDACDNTRRVEDALGRYLTDAEENEWLAFCATGQMEPVWLPEPLTPRQWVNTPHTRTCEEFQSFVVTYNGGHSNAVCS